MAQRAKRRSPQARKAPPWVPDDVLAKLGAALGDETFTRDARRTPFVWSDGVLRVVDHLGGVLAPSELEAPLDELVGHHGIERVALSMLANGTPVGRAQPAVSRFAEHAQLEPVPSAELRWEEGANGGAPEVDGAHEELDRLRRERDRLAADVTRLHEKADEKDRKLREERTAHAQTRSELTSLHQKEKNRVAELEARIAAGPDGATLARLADTETAAAARVEQAETGRNDALHAARAAEARSRALERALAAAEAEVRTVREQAARAAADAEQARKAPPTEDDLLRAASHASVAAAARMDAPEDADPLLLEAAAAIARWSTARRPAHEVPGTPTAPTELPPEAPVFDGGEDEIPSFAPPEPAAPVVAAPPARVTVLGGGGLGASAYLIEHAGLRVVLDCGVDSQGRHPPLPAGVDAVLVSHAHADHMGGVPDLLRAQPACRVYCSKPTKLLMLDQANAVGKFIPGDRVLVRDPGETYRILDGAIELTLSRVAHCLGSCAVRLRFADGLTIVYSGDLGGSGLRTLREAPPLPLGGAHAVLLESTLGDRGRTRGSYSEQLLREVAAVVAEDGCAVFPATSVGRAQELAALLAEGMASGAIPTLPVRMSPLARRVLERYRAGDRDGWLADVAYPEVVDLPADLEPEDIVAEAGYVIASGASGLQGRARLLVLAAAARKSCGVFFTSYSGPNARQRTRGDLLEVVEDDGRVISTTIVSRWQWIPSPDHPNGEELAAAVSSLSRDVPILLVHGNEEPKRRLADRLRGAGHRDVRALGDGDRVTVAAE